MSTETRIAALSAAGVSIWLDDLSRERIVSGGLRTLIDELDVVGITTNPTIFANAISAGGVYDEQLRELAAARTAPADAVHAITTHDVAAAADILLPVFEATGGRDGWVSIEVGADAAHDTEATIAETHQLVKAVDRRNVLIKIPATLEGLPAITAAIAEGISINVTLIFSLERYRQVIDAYLTGLEKAREAGHDLAAIRSVASFFVSRVDVEVDKRLDALAADGGSAAESARALKGRAGLANARVAYEIFTDSLEGERMRALAAAGANPQRPLWASTGTKSPDMPDTAYVAGLVARDVVNTMPEKTLRAFADHGEVDNAAVTGAIADAHATLDALAAAGIDLDDVTELLEREGVDKFVASGRALTATITEALGA